MQYWDVADCGRNGGVGGGLVHDVHDESQSVQTKLKVSHLIVCDLHCWRKSKISLYKGAAGKW